MRTPLYLPSRLPPHPPTSRRPSQEGPKRGPRGAQDGPKRSLETNRIFKAVQDRSKKAQDALKTPKGAVLEPSWGPLEAKIIEIRMVFV